MELQKKSALSLGSAAYVIDTQLAGDASPSIETRVLDDKGSVIFQTAQDISALKPIFQNSQQVFAKLESQHESVMSDLEQGRLTGKEIAPAAQAPGSADKETDALAHAVSLFASSDLVKATSALRAVLETYPNCSEARELLEVTYKSQSGARLPVDLSLSLKRGTEAFVGGRQRDAIESWKQCLMEEPGNRLLQLLVLTATTWSPTRRQGYANEVLAPGSPLMANARPEEAQALLLVAQTVEGQADQGPMGAPGSQSPADLDATSSGLESLVSHETDFPTTVLPAPGPEIAAAAKQDWRANPASIDSDDETQTLDALVNDEPQTEVVIVTEPAPASAGARTPAAPKPPATEEPTTKPFTVEETTAASTPPRPVNVRRPPGRARSQPPPWGLFGGAAGAVVLVAGVVFWLMSGGASVPPERMEQASSLVGTGQYAQAIAAYSGILEEFGDHADVLVERGRAKIASGDADGGVSDLKRARELDPEQAAIAEEIGDVLYSRGNFTEAIESYESAFASGAGSAEGRYRLSVSLVQLERGDEALEHVRAAINKDPQHGEAQFLFGQLLNERNRYAEAEAAFRTAEPLVEAGGDFMAQLGIALLEQEKLDEAEEVARNFIRAYSSDSRARTLLGEAYLHRKQYEPARAQLIQALRIDPRDSRAQLALGRTWLAIGKAREDLQELGKARQVLTRAQGVHEGKRLLALGQVSLAEGDLDAAERVLAQALHNGAPELPVHLSIAEARTRGSDLVGAAEQMQRASGYAPEDPAISLSLAILYSQLQEPVRAAEQFLKTIQGVGLVAPPAADAGPVVLPTPYVPLPDRFNLDRTIRDAYQAILEDSAEDPTATELQMLAESTTFVLG